MKYALNKKPITRDNLLKRIEKNYLEYIENVASNLFEFGCYEYIDNIKSNLVISIVKD